MSPVTQRIQVSEVQARLLAQLDIRDSPRNLPGHESPSSPRALVVEQDAVAREHAVTLPVVDRDPVRVELRTSVGRSGVEGGRLALGSLDDLSVQLRSGRLVEPDVLLEAAGTDGVEETEGAEPVDVAGVFSHLEGDLDVRLGAEIVDFSRLGLGDDVDEVGAVAEISVVQLELVRAWMCVSVVQIGQRTRLKGGNERSC